MITITPGVKNLKFYIYRSASCIVLVEITYPYRNQIWIHSRRHLKP